MDRPIPLPAGDVLVGFARALDPRFVRDAIEQHLLCSDHELVECVPDYLRYKQLDGALVGWRVTCQAPGGRRLSTHVTLRAAPGWRLRATAERLDARSDEHWAGLRSFALLEDVELLLVAVPVDRVLHDLRRMLRASKVRTLLQRFCPEVIESGLRFSKRWSECQIVRYKPERRAVLRWSIGEVDGHDTLRRHTGVYVRVLDSGDAGRIGSAAREAAARAGVVCPTTLAMPHDRLVIESELRGSPWRVEQRDAIDQAAACLAALHDAAPPVALELHGPVAELDSVLRIADDVASLRPEFAAITARALDDLARCPPRPRSPRLLHGDFHRGQLVVDAGGPAGLVDFDRACVGDPARDLATFYAQELVDSLSANGAESDSAASDSSAALLDAYANHANLPDARTVIWYRACAVLRQAMTPFRTLARDWPTRVHALLEHGAALARDASR